MAFKSRIDIRLEGLKEKLSRCKVVSRKEAIKKQISRLEELKETK